MIGGMYTAIRDNHGKWLASSQERFGVAGIDVVIGLTYGTDWSTNNKENQILAKLLSSGFVEVDRETQPGVIQNADGTVRVYRAIGVDYWAYAGNPTAPAAAEFTFVEVLLGLARALRIAHEKEDIGAALNERLDLLGDAFKELRFPVAADRASASPTCWPTVRGCGQVPRGGAEPGRKDRAVAQRRSPTGGHRRARRRGRQPDDRIDP